MKSPIGNGSVVVRVDGNGHVGLGHLRRCLSLSVALERLGATVRFVLNNDSRVLDMVRGQGFEAVCLDGETDVRTTGQAVHDWGAHTLIVDSYSVGSDYFAELRPAADFVVAIDDLADRFLPVDVVVNGSPDAQGLAYKGLPETRFLLGPSYALLREEFAPDPERVIRREVERVLITTGGSDPLGLTPNLIGWVRESLGAVELDVVIGPFFREVDRIEWIARSSPGVTNLHNSPSIMRFLMLQADLAITAGGQTTYELAATGTPGIAIGVTENQLPNLKALASKGILIFAGTERDQGLENELAEAVTSLALDYESRVQMSSLGRGIVDGKGAGRVARVIFDVGLGGGGLG